MVTATGQPRVILVTGATRGIGRAITEGLASRGHIVFLGSRDLDRGRATARDIPGDVRVMLIDVTDRNSIRRTHDLVREEFGYLDGLVNNAGINVSWDVPPSQTRIEDMRAVFDTDVFGAVEVTSAFIPLLRESHSPRVVNVSSFRGSLTSKDEWVGPWSPSYGTAKSCLNAITVHYARELGQEGFAFTAVSPGHVATDLTGGNAPLTPAEGAATIINLAVAPTTSANGKFLDENAEELPW
jgi:NAD(P)-dependent dehydrogenase (short-subunit alcohol dehydrogenase family)